jgi:hypothetical protein
MAILQLLTIFVCIYTNLDKPLKIRTNTDIQISYHSARIKKILLTTFLHLYIHNFPKNPLNFPKFLKYRAKSRVFPVDLTHFFLIYLRGPQTNHPKGHTPMYSIYFPNTKTWLLSLTVIDTVVTPSFTNTMTEAMKVEQDIAVSIQLHLDLTGLTGLIVLTA